MNLADRFVMLWEADAPPPDVFAFLKAQADVPPRECADILLIDQHHRWQTGDALPVEVYLREFPAVADDFELKLDLVFSELRNTAQACGKAPDLHPFIDRFPDLGDELVRQFEVAEWLDSWSGSTLDDPDAGPTDGREEAIVSLAVRMDFLSQEALDAIRQGLGTPEAGVLIEALLGRGILTARQHQLLTDLTDELANRRGSPPERAAPALGGRSDPGGSTLTDTKFSGPPAWQEAFRGAPDPHPPAPRALVEEWSGEGGGRAASRSGEHATQGPAPSPANLEILEKLGEGAMGVVHRARQATLNRVVALKRLHATARADHKQLARFRTEVQAVARLSHPNFVQIYEIGEWDGLPYFIMEHVNGGSLARKLSSGPLPIRQAAQMVEILARAMSVAHEHGIVHRDLKPANILLTLDGQPKITDFGLAKITSAQDPGHSRSGAIVGTPSYMAPEQAEGSGASASSDIYSLGATLYEMLTGRPPFRAATVYGTLVQVMNQEPVPPGRLRPKLPRDLETICLKCLEKEPQGRYAGAAALAEDLLAYLGGEPIRAHGTRSWEQALRWVRRKPARAALLAVTALTTVVLLLGIWWSNTLVVSGVAIMGLIAGGSWYHARLLSVLREMTHQQIVTERYAERLQMLGEMSRQLMAVTDLDQLLYLLGETASRLANAELATIYLIDRGRGEVWSKVKLGNDIGEIRVPLGTGIAGTVAATGQMINLPDPYADARFNPEIDRETGYRTRNLVTLPMIARSGEVIGVFQVLNKRRGVFEAEDEEVLSALAATAAVVIERARNTDRR
jgi:putative methionine-R-sulfoxide reductase with GAF domain